MPLPFENGALSFGEVVTAVGALGTASFGLVDATKAAWGGVSRHGLSFLQCLIAKVAPVKDDGAVPAASALTSAEIYATVKANWLNGMGLDDQKSVVKALIKLRLNEKSAASLALLTGVDAAALTRAARKFTGADPAAPAPVQGGAVAAAGAAGGVTGTVTGTAGAGTSAAADDAQELTPQEMNAYSRFDLLLTTAIDRAYQQADQRYRNMAKLYAGVFAVLLAELGALALRRQAGGAPAVIYLEALVVGLFAVPLAPIAKDLSSALATAVKAVKSVNG